MIYEAPGRVAATLRDLAEACGPDRPGAVCRELTKLHETIVRGGLGELAEAARPAADGAAARIPARGEFVLVVGASSAGGPTRALDEAVATRRGARRGRGAGRRAGSPGARLRDGSPRRPALPRRRLYGPTRLARMAA